MPILSTNRVMTSVCYQAYAMLLLCLLITSNVALAQIPEPNEVIDNQAFVDYIDQGRQRLEVRLSNYTYILVGEKQDFSLTNDQNRSNQSSPGQQVIFPYVIENQGNTSDRYQVSATSVAGDAGNLQNVVVVHDVNGNGLPDAGEAELTLTPTLLPGNRLNLLVVGLVPVSSRTGDEFLVDFAIESVDNIEVKAEDTAETLVVFGPNLLISKSSSEACNAPLSPGDTFSYRVGFTNSGDSAPLESEYRVSGQTLRGLLIEDEIPLGLAVLPSRVLQKAPFQAEILVQTYADRLTGEWIRYSEWMGHQQQIDGSGVVYKVALLVPAAQLEPNESGEFSIDVRVTDSATHDTFFENRVSADTDADGDADYFSNQVCNRIASAQEAVIRFLRPNNELFFARQAPSFLIDDDFIDATTYRIDNGISPYTNNLDGVIVELQSTSISPETYNLLDDGRRQVIANVRSRGTNEIAQIVLQETQPASGVYRSTAPLVLSSESGNGDVCPNNTLDSNGELKTDVRVNQINYSNNGEPACTLRTLNGDSLEVSLFDAGLGRILDDAALVDPLGIVFDSVTRNPVADARVTVCSLGENGGTPPDDGIADDICGVDAELALDPFSGNVNDLSSLSPLAIEVTGDDGRYQYPFMLAGDYFLVVEPPSGYQYPSNRPASLYPEFTVFDASYGRDGFQGNGDGVFRLSVVNPLEIIDIPLDPAEIVLDIEGSCEAGGVLQSGDRFTYLMSYANAGFVAPTERQILLDGILTSGVLIENTLPASLLLDTTQPSVATPANSQVLVQTFTDALSGRWQRLDTWANNAPDNNPVVSIAVLVPAADLAPGSQGSYQFSVRTSANLTNTTEFVNVIELDLDGDGVAEFSNSDQSSVCTATGPDASIRFVAPPLQLLVDGNVPSFSNDADFIDASFYRIEEDFSDYNSVFDSVFVELNTTSIGRNFLNNPANEGAVFLPDGRRQLPVLVESQQTGDKLQLLVQETAVASGIYRSIRPITVSNTRRGGNQFCPQIPSNNTPLTPVVDQQPPAECVVNALSDNDLRVSFLDPGLNRQIDDDARVNLRALVFDSQTLLPVENAEVSFIDENGLPAVNPFATTGNNNFTAKLTLIDGYFSFPRLLPGNYSVVVNPPGNYQFPSVVSPQELNGRVNDNGDVLRVFESSYGSAGFVNVVQSGGFSDNSLNDSLFDIPLDFIADAQLLVEKTVNQEVVEIGGLLQYRIDVKNIGGSRVNNVSVIDDLPFGFKYVKDSLRLNGNTVANPDGGVGPVLTMSIPALDTNQTQSFEYILQATAGAVDSNGINTAYAFADVAGTRIESNIARVQVEVERLGVLSDKAFVFGKVFVDSNCDAIQNHGEWPVGGVQLWMQNGSYAITDENGQYSIYGLDAGSHIIKVDPLTLPEGAQLKLLDNRHGADAGSRFVDLTPGDYHRADFAIACPKASERDRIMADIKARNSNMSGDWMLSEALRFNAIDASAGRNQRAATNTDAGLSAGTFGTQVTNQSLLAPLNDTTVLASPVDSGGVAFEQPGEDEPELLITEDVVKDITKAQAKAGTFLWPTGDVSHLGRFTVVVRDGIAPTLYVNGNAVAGSKIGEQFSNTKENAQVITWYGVDLGEGKNTLEVKGIGPFGNERVLAEKAFYKPGRPAKLLISAPKDVLPADGGRSILPIDVELVDENGYRVRGFNFFDVETEYGQFANPDVQSKVDGYQMRLRHGIGRVHLRSSAKTGENLIRVSNSEFSATYEMTFVASQRSLIAAGIVGAKAGYCSLDANGVKEADDCTDGINTQAELFLKGQVRGGMFLTLSYDKDKLGNTDLLRNINPTDYYPIMGDNSIRGYEAQSRSKLYAKLELDKSFLLWGDYVTDAGNTYRDLARVQRTLTGAKAVYDKDGIRVEAFAAETEDTRLSEEIAANGTALFYRIQQQPVVRNSDVVELITRDRDNAGLIIKVESLNRFQDYTIDYITGDIRFTRAIPSLDSELNPNFIRISYDVTNGSGDKEIVAGVRVQSQVNEELVVGASYTKDGSQQGYELSGAFAEFKPNDKAKVFVSAASMDHEDSTKASGDALYAELEMVWTPKTTTRLTWGRADQGFTNSGSIGADRQELRATHKHTFSEKLSLDAELIRSQMLSTDTANQSQRVAMTYNLSGWDLSLGARRITESNANVDTGRSTIIAGAGRGFEIFDKKGRISSEYEQTTGGGSSKRASLNGDLQLHEKLRAYMNFEQTNSQAGGAGLNTSDKRMNANIGFDTTWLPSTTVFNEYRMRGVSDGQDLEASTGVRGDYELIEGLRISPSIENINILEGEGRGNSWAASLGFTDDRSDTARLTGRIESRLEDTRDYFGVEFNRVARINLDWSVFTQEQLRYTKNDGSGNDMQNIFTLGLTRRPRLTNDYHMLFMYQWKEERGPGELDDRSVHLLSTHQNLQLSDDVILAGRLGAKWEQFDVMDSRFSSLTSVMDGRLIWDLTRRYDLDVHAGVLSTNEFKENRYSLGAGVNFLLNKNLRVGVGYNVIGFDEGDLDAEGFNEQGIYFNMEYKFDESLFYWLESEANRPVSGESISGAKGNE